MCLTCVNPTTSDPAYQANLAAAAGALATAGIDPASLSTVYGGIQFAGENGQPSNAYDTDFSNVAPRIGFAYQINPKTVIRGGYGLMYSIGLENGTFSGSSQTTSYAASLNGKYHPKQLFRQWYTVYQWGTAASRFSWRTIDCNWQLPVSRFSAAQDPLLAHYFTGAFNVNCRIR